MTFDRDAFVERWATAIGQLREHHAEDVELVRALLAEYDASRAEQPLTVVAALMLPEVRSGAKWIEFREWLPADDEGPAGYEAGDLFQCRITRDDDGDLEAWMRRQIAPVRFGTWRIRDGNGNFRLSDLDAPCTLVDPDGAP